MRGRAHESGPRPGDAAAVEIDGLTKVYGGRPRKPAVEAIASLDLQVDPGEFLVVVGPSGCGKSTLLKVVAGLLEPTSGVVRVHGRTVTGPVRDLGVVFQQPVLLPWRSALDNVLLPLELMGRDPDLEAGRARELLGEVGLSGFEGRTPGELSGGMQQRVALCRALINDPALLLMDEPFSALDEFTRESLNDQLLALWDSARKTVVYVTHSIGEAVYLADRVAVMTARPGELAALVEVPLPRPRVPEHRYDQAFVETSRRIREAMRS